MASDKGLVLVADDDPDRVRRWREKLEAQPLCASDFRVETLAGPELAAAIEELHARRREARLAPGASWSGSIWDEASIVFVDFDLVGLDLTYSPDGEAVAYLARCYSNAGIIIAVNDYGEDPFDLTLRDSPESYGDLTVGSSQLGEPFLWADPPTGFCPWYWPALPASVGRLSERSAGIVADLDAPILATLGVDGEILRAFAQSTVQFLGGSKAADQLTFADFVHSSGNGLKRRDGAGAAESQARIAAARLGKWLEFEVLQAQDVLVDAPHLAPRLPSLVRGDLDSQEPWNELARRQTVGSSLDSDRLVESSFANDGWLSRPAWWWPKVIRQDITEIKDPWAIRSSPFRFCEDISRFLPPENVRDFVSGFPESPFKRRHVADPAHAEDELSDRLARVEYSPVSSLLA